MPSQVFIVFLQNNCGRAAFLLSQTVSFLKVLKHIVTTLLWTVLSLYAVAAVSLRIPAVQRYAASKLSATLSSRLGTRVTIGRIDVGLPARFIADDVFIEDQQHKPLLRAARLTMKIDLLPLADGRISIASAQLFSAHARLYRNDGASAANFQFIVDSLVSKDTTSHTPLDLRINTLIVRHSSLSFDQWDVAPTPGRFNPSHLMLSDISAHLSIKALRDDALNINIKRLAMNEQSGLSLTGLSMQLMADNRHAVLSNLTLTMPDTRLHADSIAATFVDQETATADTQRPTQIDISMLKHFTGSISDSHITLSDLRAFHNPLKNYQRPISLSAIFSGTANSITIGQLDIAAEGDDATLSGNGSITGIDTSTPAWQAEVAQLTLSDRFVDFLVKTIGTQLPSPVRRLESIQLSGLIGGQADGTLNANAVVATAIGSATLKAHYTRDHSFSGSFDTRGIDLQRLLNDERFGTLAANVEVNGHLPLLPSQSFSAHGTVSRFDYNNQTYTNIELDGTYAANHIDGRLSVDDPEIAANVEANITATTLNDAQGTLAITNFRQGDYTLQHLNIVSGYEDGLHFVRLDSDFAEAELTGVFDYTTLAQSVAAAVASKLPTLPGLPAHIQPTDNNFALNLQLFKTDWLEKLTGLSLQLNEPVSLQAAVNDRTHHIALDAYAPHFNYGGHRYSNAVLHVASPADTMKCSLTATRYDDEDDNRLNLTLAADAADNRVNATMQWETGMSPATAVNGTLNAEAQFSQNSSGKPEARIHILPSEIRIGQTPWDVTPADIVYADRLLSVSHLTLGRGDQLITINGTASPDHHHEMTVNLNSFDVEYVLNLVGFHAVEFSGLATGTVSLTSLFSDPTMQGQLSVSNFLFEHGRMGTLQADVAWNKQYQQIDINAIADDGTDAKTYVNGYVAPTSSSHHPEPYIDLAIRANGTHIDFLHTYTKAFLSDIGGHARGAVRVIGPLSAINLTGQLIADGQATVIPLGTTYQLRNDTITFIPNDIQLNRVPIYDRNGTKGYLTGGIHHQDLTKLTFDLTVDADNLLCYEFSDFGTQSFCGTVYATGQANISGREKRVTIDCNVTPQSGTVFTYNAAQANAVASQEYITWGNGETGADDTHLVSEEASEEREPSTDIFFNLTINATQQGAMRLLMDSKTGDYITLYGDGAIRATYYNKGQFQMFGTYTVDHGTYGITIQNIIHKDFLFQPGGTIVFGGDPYDAALALQAVHTVQGVSLSDLSIGNTFSSNTIRVNCLMNIGGQPKAPQVTFDLEMPTVNADEQQMVRSLLASEQQTNQQVLYLLSIGRFYNSGQNNAAANQQDQASLAMQSLLSGTLSAQINNVLSQVIKNDSWRFGANISTGTEGWNNAEYEGIVNGRMFNNRLLINGHFGYRDKSTQATPSFIGDFDIRYLLFPNGNLALKVYNQTNDRYFTRSSLNTQGIGIIMKKDFNGITDLLPFKKVKKVKSEE